MSRWFDVRKIAPGVHALIEPGGVNSYLVQGTKQAALIDTGTGIVDIRPVVESVTHLPILVLNTHGHWDHVGGNHRFEQVGIHAAEAHLLLDPQAPASARGYLRRQREVGTLPEEVDVESIRVAPSRATFHLEQGLVVDLGQRRLQVWHTPGHSPGSVCFLDEEERLLFSGDTLYEGAIYLHLAGGDVAQMLDSYELLAQMAWDVNLVMPGHGLTPTDGRLLLEVAEGLRRTVAGEAPLKKGVSAHGAVRIAAFERFMFFLPPNWKPAGRETTTSAGKE